MGLHSLRPHFGWSVPIGLATWPHRTLCIYTYVLNRIFNCFSFFNINLWCRKKTSGNEISKQVNFINFFRKVNAHVHVCPLWTSRMMIYRRVSSTVNFAYGCGSWAGIHYRGRISINLTQYATSYNYVITNYRVGQFHSGFRLSSYEKSPSFSSVFLDDHKL